MSKIPTLRHYDERRCDNCLHGDGDGYKCRLYKEKLDTLWGVCDMWETAYDDLANDLREDE